MKNPSNRLLAVMLFIGLMTTVSIGLLHKARQHRKADVLLAFRRLESLIQAGRWDEAFALSDQSYRAYANIVNFRGDFEYLTNSSNQFVTNVEVVGLWKLMQVRLESVNQPGWGVFIEFQLEGKSWLIHDRGRWTDADL